MAQSYTATKQLRFVPQFCNLVLNCAVRTEKLRFSGKRGLDKTLWGNCVGQRALAWKRETHTHLSDLPRDVTDAAWLGFASLGCSWLLSRSHVFSRCPGQWICMAALQELSHFCPTQGSSSSCWAGGGCGKSASYSVLLIQASSLFLSQVLLPNKSFPLLNLSIGIRGN